MTGLLIRGMRVTFFAYITVVGFLSFGPIGLAAIGWWVWSYQLERRHG